MSWQTVLQETVAVWHLVLEKTGKSSSLAALGAIRTGHAGSDSMPRILHAIFLASFALILIPALSRAVLSADQSSDHAVGLHENPPSVWALTGARVVVSPDVTLPTATVVIRYGKIESVGPDVAVPADAATIDCQGRTIYAGFIDSYSEQSVASESLLKTARYWNNNVTPQLSVADQLENASLGGDAIRRQGITARLVAPEDGVIRGRSVLVAAGSGSANSQLLAVDIAQHLELTVARRGRGSSYPGSPMGAVALARQAMYDAQWYRDAWNAANADPALPRPERNDALAALEPVISGQMPIVVETSDEQFLLRANRFAGEFGLSLIVRGNGREYRRLKEIAATGRTVILPVAFPTAPNVASAESAQEASLESLMHWDLAPENPARVDAAGIRFAFTTDRLSSAGDFLKSVRTAVDRGLSATAALRALTQTPAELFKVDDQLGSVQPGRLASLIITDGDVFSSKTKILETWVTGTRYRHQPQPARTPAGQFEVRMQHHANMPDTLFVELTQKDDKITGRVSRSPIAAVAEASKSGNEKSPATTSPPDDSAEKKDDAKKDDTTDEEKSASKSSDVLTLKDPTLSDTAFTASFNGKDWGLEGIVRLTLVLTETDLSIKDKALGFGRVTWPNGVTVSATAFRITEAPSDGAANETKPATKDAAAQTPTVDAEKSTPPAAETAVTDKKSEKASFEVNYPLGAYGRQSAPDQAKLTAFLHATIWTSGPAGVIQDGTLVIGEGKILAVGSDVAVPEGAQIIDVRGMQISAGMIDCHSHAATDGGVNESTQAITCEVRIGDFIDADDITIYRQLAGGLTAANILHGSANPIGGQNQVIKLRWGLTGEDLKFAEAPGGVKFALGENVKQSNWGSEATGRYPQTRMGVEQIYRDAFQAARHYADRMDAWQKSRRGLPPRRDLELDALREIIEGRRWIHCHSYRQDEILALIRILDEYKITIGTFQHILEGYKVADAMAKHGAMASAFSDWWAYKMEVLDAIPYAGSLMHNAGVVVSFNSDDGELARHLNQEAAKAVKYGGVSREEALKFVTLNPAKQLRIDQYVGSLEVGKHADFVIWNGDPLSNFSRCEQTWIDGRPYFRRADEVEAQKQTDEMRNVLIQKILASGQKTRAAGERESDPSAEWPRFDEFCHHFHQTEQVRMLEQQRDNQ